MTDSGFEASIMAVVPTSFPSFIRPTARNVTFGVPFGRLGSLYGFDVEIMLSASSFVLMATVTVGFPNVTVYVTLGAFVPGPSGVVRVMDRTGAGVKTRPRIWSLVTCAK